MLTLYTHRSVVTFSDAAMTVLQSVNDSVCFDNDLDRHADDNRRGITVYSAVCLSVFADDTSAMITNLDTQMFHDETWKPIYFAVKRSKVKVTTSSSVFRQNAILPLWFFSYL